jgi:hypothetical protein
VTWEEHLAALQRLDHVRLQMREPGHWFVAVDNVRLEQPGSVRSVIGNGPTPEAAVEDLWALVTTVAPPAALVINRHPRRDRVHWDGARWVAVPKEPGRDA